MFWCRAALLGCLAGGLALPPASAQPGAVPLDPFDAAENLKTTSAACFAVQADVFDDHVSPADVVARVVVLECWDTLLAYWQALNKSASGAISMDRLRIGAEHTATRMILLERVARARAAPPVPPGR